MRCPKDRCRRLCDAPQAEENGHVSLLLGQDLAQWDSTGQKGARTLRKPHDGQAFHWWPGFASIRLWE